MGFIKDIKNYNYCRNCFNLLVKDTTMKRRYDPKISPLGVLYLWHKVPANTPEDYIEELIIGYLMPLNEALVAMNMDGVIKMDYTKRAEDENFYYYLIKIIPTFETISFWYFFRLGLIGVFIWYLINKFELWEQRDLIIKLLEDIWTNLKP